MTGPGKDDAIVLTAVRAGHCPTISQRMPTARGGATIGPSTF